MMNGCRVKDSGDAIPGLWLASFDRIGQLSVHSGVVFYLRDPCVALVSLSSDLFKLSSRDTSASPCSCRLAVLARRPISI